MDKQTVQRKLKKALSMTSEVADIAVHLKKPTVMGVTLVAAKALKRYIELTEEEQGSQFDGWENISIYPLHDTLYNILDAKNLLVKEPNSKPKSQHVKAHINGIQVGWILHDGWKEGPKVPPGTDISQAHNALAAFFWETISTSIKMEVNSFTGAFSLKQDVLTDSYPSGTGDEIYQDLKDFQSHGFNRAILLHGEPGTGKSHIMRYVAKRFGGLTLRLQASSLRCSDHLMGILGVLKPNTLLIDDLDRASDSNIMESFEEIKEAVKLFMVSVNDLKPLDPATIRFGRFDDLVEVSQLDESVLSKLLQGIPEEIATKLRELPITCIEEFLKNRKVKKKDFDALQAVERVQQRTELVRSLMEEKETPRKRRKEVTGKVLKTV